MAKAMNKAQEKAQKKKVIILSAMVLATGATWSKALFGKDDKPTSPVVAAASSGAVAGTPAANTATQAISAAGSISSYAQAVGRMDLWPKALNRQVHLGTIQELTPINDLLLTDQDSELALEQGNIEETPAYLSPEIPPVMEEETVLFDALRLRLTTTARFGKTTYAVINGNRVKPGEVVEVQVDGQTVRYEVRAIETRMVEVAFQGTSHILRIDLPDLQHRDQDGN